jgi:hypothetical protein
LERIDVVEDGVLSQDHAVDYVGNVQMVGVDRHTSRAAGQGSISETPISPNECNRAQCEAEEQRNPTSHCHHVSVRMPARFRDMAGKPSRDGRTPLLSRSARGNTDSRLEKKAKADSESWQAFTALANDVKTDMVTSGNAKNTIRILHQYANTPPRLQRNQRCVRNTLRRFHLDLANVSCKRARATLSRQF